PLSPRDARTGAPVAAQDEIGHNPGPSRTAPAEDGAPRPRGGSAVYRRHHAMSRRWGISRIDCEGTESTSAALHARDGVIKSMDLYEDITQIHP
ncbi:MAG: hypothetical protein ACRD2L_00885, partial [Terriglobia bacterium]